jgi:hypothetical protein
MQVMGAKAALSTRLPPGLVKTTRWTLGERTPGYLRLELTRTQSKSPHRFRARESDRAAERHEGIKRAPIESPLVIRASEPASRIS